MTNSMKNETRAFCEEYEAPKLEVLEIQVEAGFAASTPGGLTIPTWGGGTSIPF